MKKMPFSQKFLALYKTRTLDLNRIGVSFAVLTAFMMFTNISAVYVLYQMVAVLAIVFGVMFLTHAVAYAISTSVEALVLNDEEIQKLAKTKKDNDSK